MTYIQINVSEDKMTTECDLEFVRKLTAEDIKHAISRQLAELRFNNNYSLDEISALTGLSTAKIRSIESGKQTHTWGQYQRLLNFYKKKVKVLILLEDIK